MNDKRAKRKKILLAISIVLVVLELVVAYESLDCAWGKDISFKHYYNPDTHERVSIIGSIIVYCFSAVVLSAIPMSVNALIIIIVHSVLSRKDTEGPMCRLRYGGIMKDIDTGEFAVFASIKISLIAAGIAMFLGMFGVIVQQ